MQRGEELIEGLKRRHFLCFLKKKYFNSDRSLEIDSLRIVQDTGIKKNTVYRRCHEINCAQRQGQAWKINMKSVWIVYCYAKRYWSKSYMGRTRFIPVYNAQSTPLTTGSQGRNSAQEIGGENWSQGWGNLLLTDWLAFMAFSACFLIAPRTPVQQWHRPQWTGASHINHLLRKWIIIFPIGKFDRGIFFNWDCLFQNDYNSVNLTWNSPVQ